LAAITQLRAQLRSSDSHELMKGSYDRIGSAKNRMRGRQVHRALLV
jgi:hypothetical protein